MDNKKIILDACCGSRMFWFDRNRDDTIYADKRKENHILCDGRVLEINPDIQMDFTSMPFDDNYFKLVVMDPPHLDNLGKSSWMAKKYGVLGFNWETEIQEGFNECLRVLEPYGVLIFKWNEKKIKLAQLLKVLDKEPLFGHVTGKHGKTIWLTFMKKP